MLALRVLGFRVLWCRVLGLRGSSIIALLDCDADEWGLRAVCISLGRPYCHLIHQGWGAKHVCHHLKEGPLTGTGARAGL